MKYVRNKSIQFIWGVYIHHSPATEKLWKTVINIVELDSFFQVIFIGTVGHWNYSINRRKHSFWSVAPFMPAPVLLPRHREEPPAWSQCSGWEQSRARGSWAQSTGKSPALLLGVYSWLLLGSLPGLCLAITGFSIGAVGEKAVLWGWNKGKSTRGSWEGKLRDFASIFLTAEVVQGSFCIAVRKTMN